MEAASSRNSDLQRIDLYQRATDAASAERREIQAEVASLEARVVVLQAREASLNALVRTLHELLPPSQPRATPYTPNYAITGLSPELQSRAAADAEHRYRARSETS